jgi:hypothetical protein
MKKIFVTVAQQPNQGVTEKLLDIFFGVVFGFFLDKQKETKKIL